MAGQLKAGGSAFDMVREELVRKASTQDGESTAAAAAATGVHDGAAAAASYKDSATADGVAFDPGRQRGAGASNAGAYTPDTSSSKEASLKKQPRKAPLEKKRPERPPPWLGLSFEFRLPRLTVTWIHQSEVVRITLIQHAAAAFLCPWLEPPISACHCLHLLVCLFPVRVLSASYAMFLHV